MIKFSPLTSMHPSRFKLNFKFAIACLTSATLVCFWLFSFSAPPISWDSYHRIFTPSRGSLNVFRPAQQKLPEHLAKRRFLVRDFPIYLGWNNVRYTIETALLMAKILNRELVLPAFTYGNACEHEDRICENVTPLLVQDVGVDLAHVANRTQYPDPDPGTTVLKPYLPTQQRKGWVLPMEMMLDLDHIVSTWGNAIRFEDYIKLTSPTEYHSIGMSTGRWSTVYNHGLSYHVIPNSLLANFSRTVVDRLPKPVKPLLDSPEDPTVPPSLLEKCRATLQKLDGSIPKRRVKRAENKAYPTWDDSLLNGEQMTGELALGEHPLLERCIASHGMRSAYAYSFAGWWMKAPYEPVKVIKRVAKMVGFWDELHAYDEQILHIEGELHNGYPPASMIWTTREGRTQFETLVRTAIRPPAIYHKVAARLELRMRARCGGRSWRASHLRRGDFIGYEWAPKDIAKQWAHIEANIREGAMFLAREPQLLRPIHQAYNTSLEPPALQDPFYLATNTRLKEEVDFVRSKNVVLLLDLLDDTDREELGAPSNFMDTLAILEQCLIMRSGFYYGDGHSSVSGLILNQRTFHQVDERLTKIVYLKQPGDGQ